MEKLTKAQWETLADIVDRPRPFSTHYPPAKVLVRDGLAEWQDGNFSDLLAITDAGRSALSAQGTET